MEKHGLTRSTRAGARAITKKVEKDIRSHLLFGAVKRRPEEHLFTDGHGQLLTPDYVTQAFERITKDAGLKRIRFHDLRHSFGSIWAQHLPLHVLKEMMGHSSVTTTERYVHTTQEVFRHCMTEAHKKIAQENSRRAAK